MQNFSNGYTLIKAARWTGNTNFGAREFCMKNNMPPFAVDEIGGEFGLVIPTKNGDAIAKDGDWIIRIDGEYSIEKHAQFKKKYKEVSHGKTGQKLI